MAIKKIKIGSTEHELQTTIANVDGLESALAGKASTSVATTSANGLMSSSDKTKLDGIATGANKTVVDSALSGTSTNPVQNKVVTSELGKRMYDFCLEIYNGTGGNPKPVKFMTVNYSTCGSENGVAVKLGLVSGHGNGTSYAFLEDAIVRVTYLGGVEVDNFKYYGASAGAYDGATRQYGDIFWLIDETNKIVDFYVLMGQYARIQMTPAKRVTYSTGGTITQHTSCTVYSSGTKNWANNSEIATKSDIPEGQDLSAYAKKATTLSGYGITDAYTKTQVDTTVASLNSSIDGKATKATTLSGYGITDAYTKTQVDSALSGKAASSHGNHVPTTQTANNAVFLRNDNSWQTVTPANIGAVPTSRTVNGKALSSNISLSASDVGADAAGTAETKANAALASAKSYADGIKNNLLNGAGAAYDTLKELGDLIDDNADAIDALETVAASKVSATDFNSHTGNTTSHITSTERTNWNAAKTHADSAHAPSNAEKNQNAFSNVVVGSTTIAADTTTDSLTLVGSNVTLTPDATNDKVTIGITKANVVAALGYTPPTQDTNTTYGVVSTTADGLAPKRDGSTTKFLRGDGTWATPPDTNTTYGVVSTTADGLVPKRDGSTTKYLRADGTWAVPPDNDTKYTHPSHTAYTGTPTSNQTPSFGGTFNVGQVANDASGHVTSQTSRTVTIPSTLSNGTGTAGLIKTTSSVTSNSGYTACPVINGVPYYKDTDTHNTSKNIVNASATATSDTTSDISNLNVYLNHLDGNQVTSSHNIVGAGATKVTASSGGTITITSTDTKYTHPNSGVTAGTYNKVQVNAQGHVISASNEHAFSKVAVGNTTIEADNSTDTLVLAAGDNITITPDVTNDKVTIAASMPSHTHDDRYYTESEIDSKVSTLNTAINGKAASSHTHAISEVTNLQSTLDGKSNTGHTHASIKNSNGGQVSLLWIADGSSYILVPRDASENTGTHTVTLGSPEHKFLNLWLSQDAYIGNQLDVGGDASLNGALGVTGITTVTARIQPDLGSTSGGIVNLGYNNTNNRWSNIYSKTAVNTNSDINMKKDISEIDDRYIELFDLVQPYAYKFIDGTSGRYHTGFISQYVEEAMAKVGLKDTDLAFFCKDAQFEEIKDKNGNVIGEEPLLDENGEQVYSYSLRYEEYIAIMTEKIKRMEKHINELETKLEKVDEIEARLSILENA